MRIIMQASTDMIEQRVVKRHKTYGKIRLLKTLATLLDTDQVDWTQHFDH